MSERFEQAEKDLREAVDLTIRTINDTLNHGLSLGQREALQEQNITLRRAYAAYCFHRTEKSAETVVPADAR